MVVYSVGTTEDEECVECEKCGVLQCQEEFTLTMNIYSITE